MLAVASACSTRSPEGSWKDEISELSKYSESELNALDAAQDFVRFEFAHDATFISKGTIIEKTKVPGRYKILQQFESEYYGDGTFIYRIWVQDFDGDWQFGTLEIEHNGKKIYEEKGLMKSYEQALMTKPENSKAGGIDFTIIKRNAPNYVRIYTKKRLKLAQALMVFRELKDTYDAVQFSTSLNPDDSDYMAIQNGYVFEFDIDKITPLSDILISN